MMHHRYSSEPVNDEQKSAYRLFVDRLLLPSNDINTVPRNRSLFGPVAFALVMRFQGP